jgi:hypothetical protein
MDAMQRVCSLQGQSALLSALLPPAFCHAV